MSTWQNGSLCKRHAVHILVTISLVTYLAPSHSRDAYKLVSAQDPMCKELAKVLNAMKNEPPMMCRRHIPVPALDFMLPEWKALQGEDALKAALALELGRAQKGPADQVTVRFEKAKSGIDKSWSAGNLKAWEATFTILEKSGEAVRVVLVSNGECGRQYKHSNNDPTFGVLRADKFEVDPQYLRISHAPGDLILYKGTPFIAVWSNVPSATLNNPMSPRGDRQEGYLLIQSMYWRQDKAGVSDTICQFGYGRVIGYQK